MSTSQVAMTSGIDNSDDEGVDEENIDEITSSYKGFNKQAFLVSTENGDNIMEVGEEIVWKISIIVENTFDGEMQDVVVTDIIPPHLSVCEMESYTNKESFKAVKKGNGNGVTHVTWDIGSLASKKVAVLELIIDTSGKVGKPYHKGPGCYHLNSGAKLKFTDPEGIKYNVHTEKIEFDIPGEMPAMPPLLYLFEKNPTTWRIVQDCAWGRLDYNHEGPEFVYEFHGYGLEDGISYSLIYYADYEDPFINWGGDNPGWFFSKGEANQDFELFLSDTVELEVGLPDLLDFNHPHGAKLWLVLSDDYIEEDTKLDAWNPTEYLFENNLITYYDTDAPL
ncbi:MAG: hypothetical protein ACXAEX_11590 [Promethearchaeota archaeon]